MKDAYRYITSEAAAGPGTLVTDLRLGVGVHARPRHPSDVEEGHCCVDHLERRSMARCPDLSFNISSAAARLVVAGCQTVDVVFSSGDVSWTPEMSGRPSFRRTHVDSARSSVSRQPRRRSRSRRREDRHSFHMASSKEQRRCRPPAEGPKYGKMSRNDDI